MLKGVELLLPLMVEVAVAMAVGQRMVVAVGEATLTPEAMALQRNHPHLVLRVTEITGGIVMEAVVVQMLLARQF
jgi:hypothetical protein